MPHRILHIIPSLDRAGAEKQLSLLASGLPRGEFDVHVFALTRGGPLLENLHQAKIPTTVIGKSWKVDPTALWRLRREIKQLQPDLVHTWIFAGNAYGRAAAISAGVKRIVATERCVDRWKAGYEFAIDRWLARRTDRIVVNSPGVRDFYVAHGLPAEKFVVIPNGIAPAPPVSTTREQLLSELGLPMNTRLVATVGRLWPQKRVKELIWACDQINVIRGGEVHLLVIGDGPQRKMLERYRRLHHVENNVHFLGHRDDVQRIIPHVDVYWLASGYEGLPNSIMEAMAAGVPVVASDIPGNRDLVVHGETGFLFPLDVRSAPAKYTDKILSDPELAKQFSEAARRRIAEFSIEKMVERHAALYRELLG